MKVGIVKHINARPLTLYFEENSDFKGIYDHPSLLIQELLEGRVDFALVSSVEALRHSDVLDFYPGVGVFTSSKVRSILYFQNKAEAFPPAQVSTDSGSRTSVALLQCLFHLAHKHSIEIQSKPASEIETMLLQGKGSHLLFGDHALLSQASSDLFETVDLASWWNQLTGLGFAFAYWAYPKKKQIESSLFEKALDYGKANLERIIEKEERFPKESLNEYFTKELLFETNPSIEKGFSYFSDICKSLGLLEKR